MQALLIVLLATGASIAYGIAHDLVTAHVCVEYFTIGHPYLIPSTSPVLLAIAWGVVATWWVGLPLGLLLAGAARLGSAHPKLAARDLARPIARLLAVMACAALAAGLAGAILASAGVVWLVPPWSERIAADRHVAYLADLWAHSASYIAGVIGGIVLVVLTWRRRVRTSAPV